MLSATRPDAGIAVWKRSQGLFRVFTMIGYEHFCCAIGALRQVMTELPEKNVETEYFPE